MLRVLLVLEDYGELVFLQILLSKLGFDVGTLKNPKALNDSLIRMNPDILVMTAKGKRVNGTELSGHVKKMQGRPKIVMLAPLPLKDRLTKVDLQFAEAVLESPVNPPSFIETLARLNGIDHEPLLEKYRKMKPQLSKSPEIEKAYFQADGGVESFMDVQAPDRYAKFLTLDQPPPQKTFSRATISDVVKEIRRDTPDSGLDDERQAFVRAMFKRPS